MPVERDKQRIYERLVQRDAPTAYRPGVLAPAAASPLTPEQLAEVEVIGKLVVKTDSANAPLAAGVLALVADVRYWKATHDQQVHLKRELHERYESSRLECERARALLQRLADLDDPIVTHRLCGLCGEIDLDAAEADPEHENCLWRAARVFLEETR